MKQRAGSTTQPRDRPIVVLGRLSSLELVCVVCVATFALSACVAIAPKSASAAQVHHYGFTTAVSDGDGHANHIAVVPCEEKVGNLGPGFCVAELDPTYIQLDADEGSGCRQAKPSSFSVTTIPWLVWCPRSTSILVSLDSSDDIVDLTGGAVIMAPGGNWIKTSDYNSNFYSSSNINTGAGADTVYGGKGYDEIRGGNGLPSGGHDTLSGGDGNDRIWGGTGAGGDSSEIDYIYGDGGNDQQLIGEGGNDRIYGGAGDDTIEGNSGVDYLYGGPNVDTIHGGSEGDHIYGDDDKDYIWGEDGDDDIKGGGGDDELHGDNNRDRIWGEDDNDKIWGDDGDDDRGVGLRGGRGEDYIWGGIGGDEIGGDGDPDHIWGDEEGASPNDGADTIDGGTGDDVIRGGGNNDDIDGQSDWDNVDGEGGDDDIQGGSGNDTLNGSAGRDAIDGGVDWDTIDGGPDADSRSARGKVVSTGCDGLCGGSGEDTIKGGAAGDDIHGGTEHDTLRGDGGSDHIWGDDGPDDIDGGIENDHLYGGDKSDTLKGGDGDGRDYLYGEGDGDIMMGGDGNDLLDDRGEGLDQFDGGAGEDELFSQDVSCPGMSSTSKTNLADVELPKDGSCSGGSEDILTCGFGNDDHWVADWHDHVELYGSNRCEPSYYITTVFANASSGAIKVYGATRNSENTDNHFQVVQAGDGAWKIPDFGYHFIYVNDFDGRCSYPNTLRYEVVCTTPAATTDALEISANGGNDHVDVAGVDKKFKVRIDLGTPYSTLGQSAYGHDGPDDIFGGSTDDRLSGSGGDDRLFGKEGDDTLNGGGGVDELSGDANDDELQGDEDNDKLYGGSGSDEVSFSRAKGSVGVALLGSPFAVALDPPWGEGNPDTGFDTLSSIEDIEGSDFGDLLFGDDDANSVDGRRGRDLILGYGGDDDLNGGKEADTLQPGPGRDKVDGGNLQSSAVDMIDFFGSSVGVQFDLLLENQEQYTNEGYVTASHFTVIRGSNNDDVLRGNDKTNMILGLDGNDEVEGAGGIDILYGNDGADWLKSWDPDNPPPVGGPPSGDIDFVNCGDPNPPLTKFDTGDKPESEDWADLDLADAPFAVNCENISEPVPDPADFEAPPGDLDL